MISRGNMNKVLLIGRIGHTPELNHTAKGTAVTTLSVATNRDYKNAQGQEEKEVTWHRATVWAKAAEACVNHLTVGSRVHVEGELRNRKWTDKEGIERWSTEINAYKVDFLGGERKSEIPASEDAVALSIAN